MFLRYFEINIICTILAVQQPTTSNSMVPASDHVIDFKEMYFLTLIELNEFKKACKCQGQTTTEKRVTDKPPSPLPVFDKVPSEIVINFFTFENLKHNECQFTYYTGLPDCDVFNMLLDILFGIDRTYKITSRYKGNYLNFTRHSKLSIEDQFLLLLVKLRHNFGYEHLGFLFNLNVSSVGSLFLTWINYVYIKLGSIDFWPHRKVLFENYSSEFLKKYPNVIGSLDATEFTCETPSSLVVQSETYSQYKSHNTVKGLIVVDANGAIIFVSPLFTGSISDKEIIKQCGFLQCVESKLKMDFLQANDTFLADKGFVIQDLLNVHKININIPVFKITGQQFTSEDVNIIRQIAHERIHVERAFSRIKKFKVLHDTVRISLLGTFNQIWTVCCLLSNFKEALIKNNPVQL